MHLVRSSSVLVATFSLALFHCGPQSQVQSNDRVVVTGTIQREDGAPAGGQEIRLVREPSALELTAFVLGAPAFGLWCISRELTDQGCLTFKRTPSTPDGRFELSMTGAETKKEFNAARYFWAGASRKVDAGSASVVLAFYAQSTEIPLPAVRFWEKAASMTDTGADQTISWSGPSSVPDRYVVEIDTDATKSGANAILWHQDVGTATKLQIPRAVLQDFKSTWRTSARSTRPGPGTSIEITQSAPAVNLASPGLVPLSRGATCSYRSSKLASEPLLVDGACPLTDGKLDSFVQRSGTICNADASGKCDVDRPFEEVVVDLGKTITPKGLAVYGVLAARSDVTLSTSSDGTTWTTVASRLDPFTVHTPSSAMRYVRFRRDADRSASASTFDHLLDEIAVW